MIETGHDLIPVDFDPFAPQRPSLNLPLTEPQAEMWTAAAMDDDANRSYNQCFVFTLVGPLNVASMRTALNQVVHRHDALRATIATDGQSQTLRPRLEINLPLVDLSSLASTDREKQIEGLLDRECETPFDLAEGPLLRAFVVREEKDRYRFVLTAHHIVCDGWASSVLFRDLARCYEADRVGLPARLPEPASYAAYVSSGADEAAVSARRADEDYWAGQFPDGAPVLDLPLTRPRPGVKTFPGSQETLCIDADLYSAVKKTGAKAGATLFATLLAAFEALVHRLTGQGDFVVGIPLAAQAALENTNLVAHCVHTLPLRALVDPAETFVTHLRQVRKALADAQDHPHLTFGGLVRRLRVPRDLRRTTLVAVTFNIDKIGAPFDFGELSVESLTVPKAYTNFELAVNVVDSGSDMVIECAYNTDLFDASTIRRWLGYYEMLLRSVTANSEAAIGSLKLLSAQERHEALTRFNPSVKIAPGDTLHERFEARAKAHPNDVAALFEEATLTYGELNRRANGLAKRLRAMGVGPDSLVALRTERSLAAVVGILGILKAGGAYLPLDPAYPKDRVAFMLEDSGTSIAVTDGAFVADFEGGPARAIVLDESIEPSDENVRSGATPLHLAYVIYTSGSTGKPKGARITHHNVVRLMDATQDWFRFDERDVWTLFHSYAFDFSVWELWGALFYGGRVVVVPQWVSRAPESFLELIVEQGVTVLNQTPSAFRQLIQADLAAETPVPTRLRYVIFGGEALELQGLRPWFDRRGDRQPRLINMYGITETTVHVTYRPIGLADVEAGAGSVIGVPIPDLRVYLLDPYGEPVPLGVAGEIVVGGGGVADGYLNRPELTAVRFVDDPFDGPGRLYRSGDLARRLENGDLEYLGRMDQQVKIRGFRIEPAEIESVLSQQPGVNEVAVMVREDRPGDKRLVAYISTHADASGVVEALRKDMRAKLPEYMVPASIVRLPTLPLTANGKVDRTRLPAPDMLQAESRAPKEPLRTEMEQIVGKVWSELLDMAVVGPKDNFFDLGGHSLLAINAVQRLQALTGVRLHSRDLIFQTLEQIAASCEEQLASTPALPVVATAGAEKTRREGGSLLDRLLRRDRN